MTQSGFLISATHKSSGKTTISVGLAAALTERGITTQCFKKGPDYIDPMWLSRASGRPCYNLDFYVQSHNDIHSTFSCFQQADVGLVEGNKGLYDGLDVDGSNSNAALARLLKLSVVLVVDCQGITRGIAPLLQGYLNFEPVNFAGVILNKVGGSRHESKLRAAVACYTDLAVLGAVPRNHDLEISERYLGLVPSNEHGQADAVLESIRTEINAHIDVDELLSQTVKSVYTPETIVCETPKQGAGLKIGVARDEAFGFYYADDLDEFYRQGAELVFFSPLHDARLPSVDALFIGGGFPESFARELSGNEEMHYELRRFHHTGKPIYAECGGLMYLSQSITTDDNAFSMVGLIEGNIVMSERPIGRGYVKVKPTGEHPWRGEPALIHAHEFHYSQFDGPLSYPGYAYRVVRGHGVDGHRDGIVSNGLLATYTHQRHTPSNPWVSRFLKYVKQSNTGESNVYQIN